MRSGLIACAMAVGLGTLPGVAYAHDLRFPTFSRCRVDASTIAAPLEINRFDSDNSALAFTTTTDLHLENIGVETNGPGDPGIYLTRKGADGAWQLWIVSRWFDKIGPIAPGLQMVFPGATPDADAIAAVDAREKGEFRIFAFDAQRLLDMTAGKQRIVYAVRGPANGRTIKRRLHAAGRIDLDRLRTMLGWAVYIDREAGAGRLPCRASDEALPEPVDPLAYSQCRVDLVGGDPVSAWWDGGYLRLMWQHHLSPAAYLTADSNLPVDEMLATTGDAPALILSSNFFPLRLAVNFWSLPKGNGLKTSDQLHLQAEFATGRGAKTLPLDNAGGRPLAAVFGELGVDTAETAVRILGPSGQRLEESRLASGTLANGDARLREAMRQLAAMLTDPMEHCAPPTPVIIT